MGAIKRCRNMPGSCEHFVPQTFIGNHDVETHRHAGKPRARVAAGILMTVPGMPSIYYGDDRDFRDASWRGLLPTTNFARHCHQVLITCSAGFWLYRLYQDLIAAAAQPVDRARVD